MRQGGASDNLKACFRPVAMMVPDYALIGEIMMFAYGFGDSKECAAKMVATFRLCPSSFPAVHMTMACVPSRRSLPQRAISASVAARYERAQLVLRAIQDVNLSKFLPWICLL